MKTKLFTLAAVALLLTGMLLSALNMPATAAPPIAPTPVSAGRSGELPVVATLMDGQVLTDDARGGCLYTAMYEKADVQYVVDQSGTNTVTLMMQHTNDTPGAAGTQYADGPTVASGATDEVGMQQVNVYGAWSCIYADVTNTDTLTITVKALLK